MTCDHNWKPYEGFTESYFYCLTCDAKSKALASVCPLLEANASDDLQLTFYGYDHIPHDVAMDLKLPSGKMNAKT